MLESVVVGNEHEKIRSDGFRTTDLEVLGKLGKTLIESYMPEDFQNWKLLKSSRINLKNNKNYLYYDPITFIFFLFITILIEADRKHSVFIFLVIQEQKDKDENDEE